MHAVECAAGSGLLQLLRKPGTGRQLSESSGSFGGLTVPSNVALGPTGDVYLMDASTYQLKRFDPCECRFDVVPCFGGRGAGPRELRDPAGIAIDGGNLYVCDAGNHRVAVFSLRGFILRGFWVAPSEQDCPNPWRPSAIAYDSLGQAFVADPANDCVHQFSRRGRWLKCLPAGGTPTAIATDCDDRLYIALADEKDVRIIDREGKVTMASSPADAADRFPAPPFRVDSAGNLELDACCETPNANAFDRAGNAVDPVVDAAPRFELEGYLQTEALDSEIYRCQWHRVELRGTLPPGTTVTISTLTSEVIYPPDQLAALTWETVQTARELDEDGGWDCLVRSGGGRYLWLRLRLSGPGTATPALGRVRVEYPRISLRRYLPATFGADPVSADFTDRFLSIFDTTLRSVEHIVDNEALYFDPMSTPTDQDPASGQDFLSWLATWIGISLDRHWPEDKRRQWVKQAGKLFPIRGTREGLWRQLLLFLGMEPEKVCCADDEPRRRCRPEPANCAPVTKRPCAWEPPPLILEHYQLRRWLFVGAGRLGDQAELWGNSIINRSQLGGSAQAGLSQLITTPEPRLDPFRKYAHKFSVFVPASFARQESGRRALQNILASESPGHTMHDLRFVEPLFRIGVQSSIGFDAVVGRYPEGVTLDEARLGQDSVLGPAPNKRGGPSLEIGSGSRIGSSTVLN
jgi:phage tail-like protein